MRLGLAALAGSMLAAGVARAALEVPLSQALGRPVARVDVENESLVPERELRELFLLRPGDAYEPKIVQRGLSLLAQKQGIRTVVVTGSEEGGSLVVRVRVTAEPLVRSIGFSGNHAFKDKELHSRLRTAVDRGVYRPFFDSDTKAIRELYAEEGFPAAKVEARVEARSDPHWVDVVFAIEEGPPARIARVEPGALGEMERGRALALVGLSEGSRASQRKLRDGVRRLLKAYHKEGYPEARAPKPRFEREAEEVVLLLNIVAGDPMDIRVEGMGETGGGPLLEKAQGRYGEPIDADWADRVAAAMGETLRAEGYPNAIIAPQFGESFGRRRLTFRVDPGLLVRVKEVVIHGNDSLSDSRLKQFLSVLHGGFFGAPPFSQEALDRDLTVLKDEYVSKGHLDARVSADDLEVSSTGDAKLTLRVEEGALYRFGRLEFVCDGGLSPDEARAVSELSSGQIANPALLEEARVNLLAAIAKRGYDVAAVDLTTEKRPETLTLDAVYRLRASGLVRFGKLVVAGNARTRSEVILREVTFKEGESWNAKEVLVSRQKIFRLGFFQRVRIEPLETETASDTRDVRIAVEEQDAGILSFGLGYGTEEGVIASAELGHANLWGAGRAARARAEVEGRNWSWSASYREPWLLGYRMDLVLSLLHAFQSQPGYELTSTAFQASLDKKFTERIRTSLMYTLEDNNLSDVTESDEVEDINQYLLSAIGPVVAWDSRDDIFNPTKGIQASAQAEWALDALGSEVQYGRYVGSASGYLSWSKLTLALLARGGWAANLGKKADLPANKRFYLGGRTTVRGFARDEIGPEGSDGDPLGGDVMVNFRSELRFPVWRKLGATVFWDAGNVWNRHVEDPAYSDLRHGAGGGLRYGTPVGPLTLDIGYKLDRKQGESAAEWYFTIGNVF